MSGGCPYCLTPHATAAAAKACADECWEKRVKPLGHDLAVAVLQSRMTLIEAEVVRGMGMLET